MIITAWADERNIEKASRMGIPHFLPKPFTEDELLYAILTLLIDTSHKRNNITNARMAIKVIKTLPQTRKENR